MKNILCFGDSNTYGYNANKTGWGDRRFPLDVRWPGRLQLSLGSDYHIIEEGLCGRTMVFDDPALPGRRGLDWLIPCIETHLPLDLIILMLGTNDVKAIFNAPVQNLAAGLDVMLRTLRGFFAGKDLDTPHILVVAPPPIGEKIDGSWLAGEFDEGSVIRSRQLAGFYANVAEANKCRFFDASSATQLDPDECVHMDADGCRKLASALERIIRDIFS